MSILTPLDVKVMGAGGGGVTKKPIFYAFGGKDGAKLVAGQDCFVEFFKSASIKIFRILLSLKLNNISCRTITKNTCNYIL